MHRQINRYKSIVTIGFKLVKALSLYIICFPKYPCKNGYIIAFCHRQVINRLDEKQKNKSNRHAAPLAAHDGDRRRSAALNPWPRRGQEKPREAGSTDIHAVLLPIAALRRIQVL
jgi:hypothetical protein